MFFLNLDFWKEEIKADSREYAKLYKTLKKYKVKDPLLNKKAFFFNFRPRQRAFKHWLRNIKIPKDPD
jgi:hypothetical protein